MKTMKLEGLEIVKSTIQNHGNLQVAIAQDTGGKWHILQRTKYDLKALIKGREVETCLLISHGIDIDELSVVAGALAIIDASNYLKNIDDKLDLNWYHEYAHTALRSYYVSPGAKKVITMRLKGLIVLKSTIIDHGSVAIAQDTGGKWHIIWQTIDDGYMSCTDDDPAGECLRISAAKHWNARYLLSPPSTTPTIKDGAQEILDAIDHFKNPGNSEDLQLYRDYANEAIAMGQTRYAE